MMTIDVTITDLKDNPAEHITYNIQAIHGTIVLLNEEGHMHEGTITNTHTTNTLTFDASDDILSQSLLMQLELDMVNNIKKYLMKLQQHKWYQNLEPLQ